jgi:hypothetical protein
MCCEDQITWAEPVSAQGHFGDDLRRCMSDHWACLGAQYEFLPRRGNRVTLAPEQDRHGIPVAPFSQSPGDNDRRLMTAAREAMESILKAAGPNEVITIARFAPCARPTSPDSVCPDGATELCHPWHRHA